MSEKIPRSEYPWVGLSTSCRPTQCRRMACEPTELLSATPITLFHSILRWVLARIGIASSPKSDGEFQALVNRLGNALGKSTFLHDRETDWEQQLWAMVWSRQSGTILEQ